ncbi:MAG: hypothetical protein ACOYM0_01300 [Bacteroidales bacterium]
MQILLHWQFQDHLNMKQILILLLLLSCFTVAGQKRTMDTIEFVSGGKVWQFIVYDGDSVMLNGHMIRFAGTTNYWQAAGSGYIMPNPDSDQIKYPGIHLWEHEWNAPASAPVWYRLSDHTLRTHTTVSNPVVGTDTVGGEVDSYVYENNGVDAAVYVNFIDSIVVPFTLTNNGANSAITISSLEDLLINGASSITLNYGEWVTITPGDGKFIANGNKLDSAKTYDRAEADTVFVKISSGSDSLYRYTAYSSGNNNFEVYASTRSVTVTLANSNEFTITVPPGTRLVSAKIRVENLSSVALFTGTADMANKSMATRWMPVVQAWREDSGHQLMGMTTQMDRSDYTKCSINGLINTTICQIRISF